MYRHAVRPTDQLLQCRNSVCSLWEDVLCFHGAMKRKSCEVISFFVHRYLTLVSKIVRLFKPSMYSFSFIQVIKVEALDIEKKGQSSDYIVYSINEYNIYVKYSKNISCIIKL